MKRFFSSLLLTAFLAVSGSSWALSDVEGVYQIGSADDLVAFAALDDVATANAQVTADIDMAGKGWTGISGYVGTFDGGNFTISNLGAPLFASTGDAVTINNLTLEGAITVASGDNVGAFIASHDGAKINMANCVNKTNITATESDYVGGIIGKANVSSNNSENALKNCINQGAISGKSYTAGLIGAQVWSNGGNECLHITNCANTGIVSGVDFVGGLVGANSCRIYYDDCYNEGKISATGASVGGLLGRGNRGWQYFTRCHNSAVVSGASQVAGLFGDYYRGALSYTTFEECYNEGDVYGTGDNVGGIMGRAYVNNSSPFEFIRCYNAGNIYGPGSFRPSAIAHWSNATVTMTDCWNVGEIRSLDDDFGASDVNTLISACFSQNVTNSYDFANAAMTPNPGLPAGYEDGWLTNGHFCYILNGESSESPKWYQDIEGDAYPVLNNTHGVVYAVAAYKCDGVTPKGAVSYNNVNNSVVDAHTFADGFCTECGSANSDYILPNGDGFYEINNAKELQWFAALVSINEEATAKAKLMADIDMDGKGWTGITGFKGTFDGGGFTISNLGAPLFATTGDGVILKNLTLEGAITTDETAAIGAFVATHSGGIFTAENLTNKTSVTAAEATNVGGIVGYFAPTAAGCTFTDCQNLAAINGKSAVGGVIGYYYYDNSSNAIFLYDCINTADITASGNAVGGIVGSMLGRFESSGGFNSGNITSTGGDYAGGCFGSSTQYLKTVSKFKNSGNITANNSAGGIIGYFYNTGKTLYLYIHTCINSGDVTATTYAGGMIGRVRASSNYLYYNNDINTGTITGVPAAGIAAESRRGDFVYCCNAGTIITNASGRALTCGGTGATMKNCWNSGEIVLSDGELSGETLVQSSGTVTITNSYDLANAAMSPTHGAPAGYEDAWLANGAFTYYINNEAGESTYKQTIGTDAHPVFVGEVVYKTSNAGWATFFDTTSAYTFNGVKAYTGKINGESLTLTEVSQANAGTPVILEGYYYNKVVTETPAEMPENDLKGAEADTPADGTQYVLAVKDDVVGFYQATDGTIAAGKAYLLYAGGGVKGFTFGTATSIASPLGETEERTIIYDLSGRRVEKATKGLYIVNGKKVLK